MHLYPGAVVGASDVAALDLDRGDSDPGPENHQVGLTVTFAVGERQVRPENGIVGKLFAQRLPRDAFGVGLEALGVGEAARGHRTCLPDPADYFAGPRTMLHLRHTRSTADKVVWPSLMLDRCRSGSR